MEMYFRFQQNRTINEESIFFEWGRQGDPNLQILILIIIGKHMKMLSCVSNFSKLYHQ